MKTVLLVVGVLVLVLVGVVGGFVLGATNALGQVTIPGVGTVGSNRNAQFGRFDPSRLSPEQLQQMRQARGTPGAQGFFQGGQQAGGQAGGQGAIAGTIESIENGILTIKTQNGTVTVKATDTTLIQKQMNVSLGDLQVGEQVFVSGSRGSDGVTTARSIRVITESAP